MAMVNAIEFLEYSPFKSAERVLVLEEPVVEAQAEKEGEDSNDREEGRKVQNPTSCQRKLTPMW